MSTGSAPRAKLLLKARPTAAQLADRLRPPLPDGLELYLDAADLADESAMRDIEARWHALDLPPDFAVTVEGPVRSLDGEFFHVGREAPADSELVKRLAGFSRLLGARAVNIHVIAPAAANSLTTSQRQKTLRRSLPLLSAFVEYVAAGGMVPTIENMPPVLRMREGGFYFSCVGMHPEDLLWLVEHVQGLRLCLDVSHAQLVVNAGAQAQQGRSNGPHPQLIPAGKATRTQAPTFPELMAFLRLLPAPRSVRQFLEAVRGDLETAHISNAQGLLGEGNPYGEGDLDLDALLPDLAAAARYLVTETLEAEPDNAVRMREALQRMRRVLVPLPSG